MISKYDLAERRIIKKKKTITKFSICVYVWLPNNMCGCVACARNMRKYACVVSDVE